MRSFIVTIAAVSFLSMTVIGQNSPAEVVKVFPYVQSADAVAPLAAMRNWKSGDWSGFFQLMEDDSMKLHAIYALDAYVHQAARDAAYRPKAAKVLDKAWKLSKSGDNKYRVIEAMGRLGDDASVKLLASMLGTEYTADAAKALAVIRSANAIAALEKASTSASGTDKQHIDMALSHARSQGIMSSGLISPSFQLSKKEKKAGFEVLFDGSHMDRWMGNKLAYVIEDGAIAVKPSGGSGGNLYTVDEYGDFEFRFEFLLTPGANNGLGIRTPPKGDAAYVGMELQILDNEADKYKNLKPYQYHGSVYGVMPAKRGFLKPAGEWNQQTVIAKGTRIQVILNGETIMDGDIQDAITNGAPDGNKHPGLKNTKGHIGFLGHGDVVKFRNIRVRPL